MLPRLSFYSVIVSTLVLMLGMSVNVHAKACVIELKIPQLKVNDKSCFESVGSSLKYFNPLCDAQRKQPNVTVTDMTKCPKGAFAYCYTNYAVVAGGFRTYTYSRASIKSLKVSCNSKSPGMPGGQWTQLRK